MTGAGQCCSSVRKFVPRRRPHMTQSGQSTGYKLANDGHAITAALSWASQFAINSALYSVSAGSLCEVLAGLVWRRVPTAYWLPSSRWQVTQDLTMKADGDNAVPRRIATVPPELGIGDCQTPSVLDV